jgi:hypothetical protein
MKRKYYLPKDDSGKDLWLKNFANKISLYATKYGITAAEVSDMTASALHFSYWLNYKNQYEEFGRKITAYKNEGRDGIAPGALASVPPAAPTLPAAPPVAVAGFFVRAVSLANRIKKHISSTEADIKDLGLLGEDTSFDYLNAVPQMSLRLGSAGQPEIVWAKGPFDSLEILVDRGNGFVLLAIDTRPNYTDNAPLPAVGTSEIWKYKAIYHLNDDRIGQWTSEYSISVKSA